MWRRVFVSLFLGLVLSSEGIVEEEEEVGLIGDGVAEGS